MRKVCVIITARPSYSRIRSALVALKARDDIELQVVVAASALLDRYGSVIDEIERDGFEIANKVYMVLEGEQLLTMAKTTGIGMIELATALDNLKPDFVVTIADRHETLATAVAAAYMNIPLVHIQGGEITGSIDEKVRHAVTKLADYHLVSTELAAERVIRMGEDPDTVIVTGCPSIDIAAKVLDKPELDFDPMQKYGGVGAQLDLSNGYLVVLQHSVTTEHDLARKQVQATLHAVTDSGFPTLWFWPNPDAGSDGTSGGDPRVSGGLQPAKSTLLQEHGARRLLAAPLSLALSGGKLERWHPRVLVPRGACGQHRRQADWTRPRRQRTRRGLRSRGHRGRHPDPGRQGPPSKRSSLR